MDVGTLPDFVANPDPMLYVHGKPIVLDFETTGLDKGLPSNPGNRLLMASWWTPGMEAPVSLWGSEYDMGPLMDAIAGADFIVAHNAKFELGWLQRCGLDLRQAVVYDTMIAEYVRGGNRYKPQQLSLEKCGQRHGLGGKLGIISKMIKKGVPPEDIPQHWMDRYCIRDVELTRNLYYKQLRTLQERNLLPIVYSRCLLSPALADIEKNGMQIDRDMVIQLAKQTEREYVAITEEFTEFCGGVNVASPPQMRTVVFETLGFRPPLDHKRQPALTAKGDYSMEAKVLDRLRATTLKQQQFLDLRKQWAALHSDITKYLRKLRACSEDAGGVLRATFNQTATQTHRLSSSGLEYKIQFQNMNRKFKPAFTARNEGWLVVESDGAQLEFRTAVHLGRDPVGLADICAGTDVHAYTSAVLTAAGQETDRQHAKEHTFKPLYGGLSGTEAERTYYDAFRHKYSAVYDTQYGWTVEVAKTKQLITEWGMRYYWPQCEMTQNGYITFTTSIFNYPVQAFATAEIIPAALVCMWHRMGSLDCQGFLVNTVHDSIIGEIPPEELPLWNVLSKQCFTTDAYELMGRLYGVHITVPLAAGVTYGTNWGSKESKATEVVYTAEDELWRPAAIKAGMLT